MICVEQINNDKFIKCYFHALCCLYMVGSIALVDLKQTISDAFSQQITFFYSQYGYVK